MGLGKTLDILAVIASHKRSSHDPNMVSNTLMSTLIVCPATLLDQWVISVFLLRISSVVSLYH